MSDKKLEEKEIAIEKGKFLKWLDNYWYYYKWHTIVVAFFAVVLAVCLIQSLTTEKKDILITYAGPTAFAGDEKLAVQSALTESLPEGYGDKGKDGKVGFLSYIIYSKEQIKEIEDQNPDAYVDTVFNSNEYSTLNSQYGSGNSSIYLLDEWLYKALFDSDGTTKRLKPLSEVYGETPEGAIDAYGVRLGDTELYKNNPEMKVLPADTIVCLHEKVAAQKNKDYEKEVEAFREIARLAPAEVNE